MLPIVAALGAILIMPLFALANVGVPLAVQAMTSPVSIAVTLGLVLGKPLGIFLFSWFTVNFLGGRLPGKVNWSNHIFILFVLNYDFSNLEKIEIEK
jgi:NhaA family Na+:H+ antiporter